MYGSLIAMLGEIICLFVIFSDPMSKLLMVIGFVINCIGLSYLIRVWRNYSKSHKELMKILKGG